MPGETARDMLKNNWKMWGPKGLMFTHGLFELGSAILLAPMAFDKYFPTEKDIKSIKKLRVNRIFHKSSQKKKSNLTYKHKITYKRGWTPKNSREQFAQS